jgi:hypothetical protein
LIDNILEPGSLQGLLLHAPERWRDGGLHWGGWSFLKMWAPERLDVAEICIVVFVWARFLL